jgi:4-diphosphocytidyl-2-C-methyl-D-erythritol kinase
MQLERLAPAKINLFLHVGPLGADGYHPVCSLMSFADVGDVVRLAHAPEMAFEASGPFAEQLGGGDNLVVKARDALIAAYEGTWPTFRLTLDKRLPVAAGLGGGSSDAAAALNLICEAFELRDGGRLLRNRGLIQVSVSQRGIESLPDGALAPDPDPDDVLAQIARGLGADVTACLAGAPVLARGRGDECDYPPVFPDVDAVLVNPGVPSSTAAVYAAFDAAGAGTQADEPLWPDPLETPQALADYLESCRNDLEAPAVSLQPAIAEVLAALRERPETLLARMSGSGATCFALCASAREARDLAFAIADAHPGWWTQPCRLSGFHP